MASIGTIEQGMARWAAELGAAGFDVDVRSYRSGYRHGQVGAEIDVSSVDVIIKLAYPRAIDDPYDDANGDLYFDTRFVAGGYYTSYGIGGDVGWRAMKAETQRRILKELREDSAILTRAQERALGVR